MLNDLAEFLHCIALNWEFLIWMNVSEYTNYYTILCIVNANSKTKLGWLTLSFKNNYILSTNSYSVVVRIKIENTVGELQE